MTGRSNNLPARRVFGFFLRAVVVYVLLMAPWPGVGEFYGTLYRAAGGAAFGSFGSSGAVAFRRLERDDPVQDVEMLLTNRRGVQGSMSSSSRLIGYVPTAFFVALAVATPTPWLRRWRVLVWGLLLIHVFILLKLALLLLNGFSDDNPLAIFELGPSVKATVRYLAKGVMPAMNFVVPIFVWIVVGFRRADWLAGPAPAKRGR